MAAHGTAVDRDARDDYEPKRPMPTYEYACKACGHTFEEIQKMSEPAIDVCPKCGQRQAQRLISQGNFILKGGGWYTTGGYGSTSKPSGGGDDGGGSSSSTTSPKTETKTETKTDTGSSSGGTGGSGGGGTTKSAA
jgi:putative FmdB family regulatory protein